MTTYATYTDDFKETMVKKVLANPYKSVKQVSNETGVPSSTLGNWVRKYNQHKGITLSKKKKWTAEEKFEAVILTASMNEAERSAFCRKNGIYPEDINSWKQEAISGCGAAPNNKELKKSKNREKALEKETKRLKKELSRKDKALAEAAALLVLKKKAQRLWGEPEEDE